MDKFEKHIRSNKELFDIHKPDKAKLWGNISAQLGDPQPKVIPLWRKSVVRIAASIALVLGLSGIIGVTLFNTGNQQYQDTLVTKELQGIDMHYKALVSHQIQLVKDHPKLSENDKVEFLGFIDELDEEYELLKLEMNKNLDNEIVLEAIITNYKKRIELIENLLQQINESKITDDNDGYNL
jgi:hypothetical protein